MYCKKCGQEMAEGWAFCKSCGEKTGVVSKKLAKGKYGTAIWTKSVFSTSFFVMLIAYGIYAGYMLSLWFSDNEYLQELFEAINESNIATQILFFLTMLCPMSITVGVIVIFVKTVMRNFRFAVGLWLMKGGLIGLAVAAGMAFLVFGAAGLDEGVGQYLLLSIAFGYSAIYFLLSCRAITKGYKYLTSDKDVALFGQVIRSGIYAGIHALILLWMYNNAEIEYIAREIEFFSTFRTLMLIHLVALIAMSLFWNRYRWNIENYIPHTVKTQELEGKWLCAKCGDYNDNASRTCKGCGHTR